jgi:lipoyl(octanoyl) transferase
MRDGWSVLGNGASPAAFNMAYDEAVLLDAVEIGHPILRFYSWSEPAATFGYFQSFEAVCQATALRPLIRRPTGGGIVPHDRDWTYSLIVPRGHEWHALNARRSYERIHRWIDAAFQKLGVSTHLASRTVDGEGRCFAGYEEHDVLFGGNKIGGAAQRRTRDGLLIQGSIQPDESFPDRGDWQLMMTEIGGDHFGSPAGTRANDLKEGLERRARDLARDKYGDPAYNRKR